jgi:hypothetical protein
MLPPAPSAAARASWQTAQTEDPAPAPPAEPDAGAVKAPPATTVIDKHEGQGILGKSVLDASGKEMGRIVNVIVDRAGQPRAVVIDFGGFLGVGSRKIAVDWSALRFAPTGEKPDRITLDLMRDQVKAAPEYKDGRPIVVLGPSGGTQTLPDNVPFTVEP